MWRPTSTLRRILIKIRASTRPDDNPIRAATMGRMAARDEGSEMGADGLIACVEGWPAERFRSDEGRLAGHWNPGRDNERMETGNGALLFREWIFTNILGSAGTFLVAIGFKM